MTEFEKYQKDVDKFFRDDSPKIFGNYTQEHASYVIHKLLESAEKDIVLLSGKYPCDFYKEDLEEDFERAIKRIDAAGGVVRVITADGQVSEQLQTLVQTLGKTLEYRPAEYKGDKPISHFMVVDGKRYRLEHPHAVAENTPESVAAEVCCNGEDKAKDLLSFFDSVWHILGDSETSK